MLRHVKTILIVTVALWGLVGVLQNIVDWKGTIGAVQAVTSMVTIDGGAASWQATSNGIVLWLGALFIVLSKLAAGILCAFGAWRMWRARSGDAMAFDDAKNIALAGCGIAVIMLFGGFIVIAESWFELWRSEAMRGPVLESAFRYCGLIALIAVFVATNDNRLADRN
jgi:predicted small integral membrane protein